MQAVEAIAPEKTLTEQIADEKAKLMQMRQRANQALDTVTNYQEDLDKARDNSDEMFFLHTSVPSETNADNYTKAKQHVMKLNIEYEESKAAQRRLPKRLKASENIIRNLERQKQVAVNALANKKYAKKRELAMGRAEEAIASAVSMSALMSEGGSLDSFLSLGNVSVHELVNTIVSTPDFRERVDAEHKKLMAALHIEDV
ncbi:hypothetical protein N9100_01680 [Gammaproteobacteria bacterium]|nr:hypothetical protein [Gammaproteobacteria bacterium]